MLISDGLSIHAIARELNRLGIEYQLGAKWTHHTVAEVLTNPKYAGFQTYGRTSSRLCTPTIKLPRSEWILKQGAHQAVVDHTSFLKAQQVLAARTGNKSNQELLEKLRLLLYREGRLSLRLIKESSDMPSPSTYRHRFGSLQLAYQRIGYGHPEDFGPIDLRRRTQSLREDLIAQIVKMFPDDITVVRAGKRWRSQLRLRNGTQVSVLVARSVTVWKSTVRWIIDPAKHEHGVTLLARLDLENRFVLDLPRRSTSRPAR